MILITGANGQIGTVLSAALAERYGAEQILVTDIRQPTSPTGRFELLDVTDKGRLRDLVGQYGVTQVYHLASILSARGEKDPSLAWRVNMEGLLHVLDVAADAGMEKVFFPSSIAVFGDGIDLQMAPQDGPLLPQTVYGISKVAGELWCDHYFRTRGLDVRSLRFPGIIGYQSLPGGGTTDYAVEIYHAAVQGEVFRCYVASDVKLPMMYMDDAIKAIFDLMDAPKDAITIRQSYNVAAMSFSPREIYQSIRQYKPEFQMEYVPDYRNEIARAWPDDLDDDAARRDWHWRPEFDLDAMTRDMLAHLEVRYAAR